MAAKSLKCHIQIVHMIQRILRDVEICFPFFILSALITVEHRFTPGTSEFHRPVIYFVKGQQHMLRCDLVVADAGLNEEGRALAACLAGRYPTLTLCCWEELERHMNEG